MTAVSGTPALNGVLMKPTELKRVQELLADIERATNQLKDELVNIRARELHESWKSPMKKKKTEASI